MNKKSGVVRTLISVLVFFLIFAVIVGDSFAEEKSVISSKGIPKWRKIAVIENAGRSIDEPINWCGKSSIVYFHITYQHEGNFEGGIELYDLKTGKGRWIIEDSKTARPFCSADGSIVFWYSDGLTGWYDLGGNATKRSKTTILWGHDTKIGRTWVIIEGFELIPTLKKPKVHLVGISPINDSILFSFPDQKELASLPINLPDWRVLKISVDTLLGKPCGGGGWAKDANYFYLNIEPYNIFIAKSGECQMAIYDANGEFQRYVGRIPKSKDRYPHEAVLVQGGYYILDRTHNLITRMDIETGEKKSYPVPEGTQGFDISSRGEVIYWAFRKRVKEKESNKWFAANIWFANKIGDKPYLLEFEGSTPKFSPSGEYVYFFSGANNETTILKRE